MFLIILNDSVEPVCCQYSLIEPLKDLKVHGANWSQKLIKSAICMLFVLSTRLIWNFRVMYY